MKAGGRSAGPSAVPTQPPGPLLRPDLGPAPPSQPRRLGLATATLWNFQFSANVRVMTEAQRPWSDIMAEEL